MARTKNFGEIIRKKIADDPALAAEIDDISFNAEIASVIYRARTEAGLTQDALADLVNTKQSVIARLEAWDYPGHSLTMLKRIGDALGKRLHVEFRPRFTEFAERSHSTVVIPNIAWGQVPIWTPTIHFPLTDSCKQFDSVQADFGLVA